MKKSEFINILSGGIAFLNFISMLFCMLFYFRFRDSFHGFFEFILSFKELNMNLDPTMIDTGMFYFFILIIFKNIGGTILGLTLYLRFNIARLLTIFSFIITSLWIFFSLAVSSLELVKGLIRAEVLDVFSTMIGVFISISILSFFFWLISKLMSQSIKREFLQKV